MKFNKKSLLKSLYKISTVLFLVGYNFAPAVFAIGDISKLEVKQDQSVSVTTEETSEVLNEVPVDTSEDILEKGISDPASIAEGEGISSKAAPPFREDVLPKALLNSTIGQYTISSTSGIWTGVTPSGVASGLNTNIIRWGNSTGYGQSGLKFTSAGSQSFSPNDVFLIGDLTHMNWPVTGYTANTATLGVTLNFSNPALTPNPTFTYDFKIEETTNSGTCPSWHITGHPKCDDRISFPNSYGQEVFTIGDMKYTLKIDGFQDAYPVGSPVSRFITEENKDNKAFLVGHLSSVLVEKPAISITKKVNGDDANTTPGIFVGIGDPVAFTYIVQNTGNVELTNITVSDNKGVSVTCPGTVLAAGASMTCTSVESLTAIEGQYTNIGTVVGTHSTGTVDASDSANYMGVKKVDICHATGSHNNPYTDAKASMTADAGGHNGHTGPVWYPGITVTWGDIIPPFDYSGGHYPGKNWDAYGQSVLANGCTVPTGTLKVNKVTIPSTDTTSFNITGTGTPAASGAPTFHNGNTGTISHGNPHTYTVSPGAYSVSETVPTGWKEVSNTCNNIVIAKGETKECTITNTKYGSITIVKDARPSSGQIFKFTTTDEGLSAFELVDNSDDSNPSKVFTDLLPGTYSVSEVVSSDWDLTSTKCSDGSPVTAIDLSAGEDITCTFVNVKRGSISGHKYYDEDGILGTDDDKLNPLKDWTICIDSDGDGKIDKDKDSCTKTDTLGKYSFSKIKPGTYKVGEILEIGWINLTGLVQEVQVQAGEDKLLDFSNAKRPQLIVIKNVVNQDNDGTKNASDFKITVTAENPTLSTFNGSEEGTEVMIDAGTYKVTEEEDTENYTAKYEGCEGTINVGEVKTCTITNTGIDHKPKIEVTKEADKTSVDETGENVTFTFTVKNISKVDTVEILSLVDSEFGNLTGDDDCKVGTKLAPNATCTFTITKFIEGDSSGDSHYNKFTATVKDEEGNETSGEDNATVTFEDVAPTLDVTKTVDDDSIPETGQEVTFTFTVKNTSKESVTITSLSDDVFTTLTGSDDCKVGTVLPAEGSCSFTHTTTLTGDASGLAHKNTFTVTVEDNDGSTATDSDDETITFENVAPTLEVTKTVDDASIPETGQEVTFTFTVKNTSKESVTITSLSDDVFTTLTGSDDCKVGTVLPAGGSCSFTHTTTLTGDATGLAHKNTFTVTVEDNDGSTVTDSDDATVNFEDVEPSIEVLKTAGVTEIPETGGDVTFTYKVTNTGLEDIEITSLEDDKFGSLEVDEDCKVGTILSAGESCEFEATFTIPANTPGDPNAPAVHKNIFTATGKDNEDNSTTGEDDEEVKLTPVPSLKLVKEVVHKYNSDETITAADWTLYANGGGGFSYAGDTNEFRFVKAGVAYDLSEEGIYSPQFEASDWTCTGGELTGSTLTLAAEDDIVCTITNTALPAAVKVYKDVLDGFSKDIFKVQLEDGGEVQDISDTEDADKRLVAEFRDLDAGTYNPEEVELPDGYIAQGCVPVEGYSATVRNGEETEFVCINKVIDPILQIEKSNDAVVTLSAGDIVTYTITVTAPDDGGEGTYILNNVIVSDIAPAGFEYMLGSWTVEKNGVDITGEVPEPTYDGENTAQWMIGGMKEGDVVVLTYQTKIFKEQDPGNYPDIAWVAGTSLIDGAVLGASVVDPLTPFVGTNVTITEPVETEEGEVLGASITLPDTGASTYLTLGALIMMILGAITLLLKPFKKLSYALLTGLMALSFVTLLTPNRVLAADSDIQVRIMQPATPTNKTSFNVGFVALDLNNKEVTVECYKDGTLFKTIPNANAGNCPATVDASGTYTFYVIAKSASGEQKSEDAIVVVDLVKPSPVIDYSKAGNVIKFKTGNDAKVVKVEIHRSTTPKYTANESTRVKTMNVEPNEEYSWTDTTAEAGKTYYYALRTVDAIGNTSTIVSDPEVVEVPAATTNTRTGDVAGQTDTKKEGEVAGETDDITEGEDTEVKKTEEGKEKVDIKETGKNILSKWYFWVIVVVVIGGIAFYVKKQKSN